MLLPSSPISLLTLLQAFMTITLAATTTSVKNITLEHYSDTFAIGESAPRLSWKIETEKRGWRQKGYEIEVFGEEDEGRERGSSGFVESGESVLVEWPFDSLISHETVLLRVKVTDVDDEETQWSEAIKVEAGLIGPDAWSGVQLVQAVPGTDPEKSIPPVRFIRSFESRKGIAKARLHITAHGLYEAYLNNNLIGDHVLAPGWTSYDHELQYQSYNVTELVRKGNNVLGVYVAEGWFAGRLSNGPNRHLWGNTLGVICQLVITYADGSTQKVVTDGKWLYKPGGPVTRAEIYDGEDFDARIELSWSASGNTDQYIWHNAQPTTLPHTLRAMDGPPIRRVEDIRPASVRKTGSDAHVIDFGQNLVGWLRVVANGPAGHQITFTHAEALEHEQFTTKPLRSATQRDHLTLSGKDVIWSPRFTFHGFRYVEVLNWHGTEADLMNNITAVVIHTDMQRTGYLTTSNELLNKLHENVRWSMKGNFLGIPTDCPQRDERLGWTGDIQAFAPTATFLYDCTALLKSYLRNLASEQSSDGIPPFVSPDALRTPPSPRAVWGDALIHVPHALYQATSDTKILSDQFASMVSWLTQGIPRSADQLWQDVEQFGDWLDPTAPPGDAGRAMTNRTLVADSFSIASTDLFIDVCHALGEHDLASMYKDWATQLRKAFTKRWILGSNPMLDTQTAYAMAIHFNLLPSPTQINDARTRLVDLVTKANYTVATGFAGTPIIGHALTRVSETPTFYKMLLQTQCPSWLYPLTKNATTMWERWDSMLPNGDLNTPAMTSFNHYALGSVANWMHTNIAGFQILEAGWRRFALKPVPGGDLIWAKARFESPYGVIACEWEIVDDVLTAQFVVPPNTEARIALPGVEERWVGSGFHTMGTSLKSVGVGAEQEGQVGEPEDAQKVLSELGVDAERL